MFFSKEGDDIGTEVSPIFYVLCSSSANRNWDKLLQSFNIHVMYDKIIEMIHFT